MAGLICSSCSHENRETAAFCESCGSRLSQTCPSCAAELRPAAKFCDTCGASLVRAPAAVPVAAPREYTPPHLAERILRNRSAIEGERRNVTVLFADAVGSTPLGERLDAEEVYSFIQGCYARMLEAVHRYEGTVNQFTGDGVMAIFGAPIAHEDSARRAVAASLDMQRALEKYAAESQARYPVSCRFRVGLNTGPVVVGRIGDDLSMDYTAVGDTSNLAARMEQMAEPGTVYMTGATYRQVADYFECEDLGALDVKGKAEPVRVYRALGDKGVRTRLEAAAQGRGLTPFTGRARELAVLQDFYAQASGGQGQIVFVTGDPGIGKSRLLLEFRRSLPEDAAWLEGHCISYGEGIPYLPIIDIVKRAFAVEEGDDDGAIIRRIDEGSAPWEPARQKTVPYLKYLLQVDPGDEIVALMDPMERRAGLLDGLRALGAELSLQHPLVVVVEDLHWADEQSEEVLRALAGGVSASPVFLVITYRPGYPHTLGDLPHAHRLALGELPTTASATLACGVLHGSSIPDEVASLICARAEGNPLFLEEVTKGLVETGVLQPAGDGYTLNRKLDDVHVPDTLQGVILSRIDRLAREAKESLQLASVIGREFTVRLLRRISDIHAELEGILGQLKGLELIYEKSYFPELAYMFKHAMTHDVAYSTLLLEKRRALHRVVATAIEELYSDRLAEQFETLAYHYQQAEMWDKALDYLRRAGEKAAAAFANQEARRFYESAIQVCDRIGDTELRAKAELVEARAYISFTVGAVDDAIADFRRLTEIAIQLPDRRLQALALSLRSFAEFFAHELDIAQTTAREALDLGAGDPDASLMGGMALAWSQLFTDKFDDFRRTLTGLDRSGEQATHPFVRGAWGWGRPLIQHWRGDFDGALEMTARSRPEIEASHDVTILLWARWGEAIMRGHKGEYETALGMLTEDLATSERIGHVLLWTRSLNTIGWVYGELQHLERALEWNTRGLDAARAAGFPDPEIESNAALNVGDNLMALGRLDEAEERYAAVERIYRDPAPAERFMLWRYAQHMLHSYGELWLLRGDPDKALAYATECLQRAEMSESRKNIVKARRLRGQALAAAGDLEAAERELDTALAIARDIANPRQLWETLAAVAGVHARLGRDATELYAQAHAVCESVAAGLSDPALRQTFLGSPRVRAIREAAGA
jgi:class 3 adenylate cyclase/tetratricopeptide (TPR) repeat protein